MTTLPAPSDGGAHGHGAHAGHDGHASHGDHGAHSHDHSKYPFLAHHFETPAQQFDSGKLGMWLFLATEVLFFGGLFVWYVVLRSQHPEIFSYAAQYLNTLLGGINTVVLILSSLTMALAVRCAQTNNRKGLVLCLVLTLMGAFGFLVIKWFEYSHKFHENLLWGEAFYEPVQHEGEHGGHGGEPGGHGAGGHAAAPAVTSFALSATPISADSGTAAPQAAPAAASPASPPQATGVSTAPGVPAVEPSSVAPAARAPGGVKANVDPIQYVDIVHGPHIPTGRHLDDAKLPPNTHLFFGVYFAMTGLHAIHVIVGIGVISWLIVMAVRGRFNSQYYTPVDLGGLYWHIVDLVWIFLFPLFYIIH